MAPPGSNRPPSTFRSNEHGFESSFFNVIFASLLSERGCARPVGCLGSGWLVGPLRLLLIAFLHLVGGSRKGKSPLQGQGTKRGVFSCSK